MISINSKIEIYLYGGSTDMRKGMHGLVMLIEENIEKKCGKEGLFVFRNGNCPVRPVHEWGSTICTFCIFG